MLPEDKKNEDYSIIEKIIIVILWFMVYQIIGEKDLKKNGYITKHRSRIICVIIGIILYATIILLANI